MNPVNKYLDPFGEIVHNVYRSKSFVKQFIIFQASLFPYAIFYHLTTINPPAIVTVGVSLWCIFNLLPMCTMAVILYYTLQDYVSQRKWKSLKQRQLDSYSEN